MSAVTLFFDEENSRAHGDGALADETAWLADDLDCRFWSVALREDLRNKLPDLRSDNLESLVLIPDVPFGVAGPGLTEAATDV